MKFDDFDSLMRVYETANDRCVPPGLYLVARLDGRNFSRLTKETYKFKAPFDDQFRDYMIETVKHLMDCGFKVVYGYTESDEISLLFDLAERSFSGKHRKYNSILAGEASAKMSLLLGGMAAFDCRLCELPNRNLVVDYFRWRAADAHRNALNAHCYWRLRQDNFSPRAATQKLAHLNIDQMNELLFGYGLNFNDLPAWQKRGIGFYWTTDLKNGFNPKSGQPTQSSRRHLRVDLELPMKDDYAALLTALLDKMESAPKQSRER